MKTSIGLILLWSAATFAAGEAPIEDARRALDAFLRINAADGVTTEEGRALLAGEAAARWQTPSVGPIQGSADKIVRINAVYAVARIPADATGQPDIYFYLRHTDSRWRIEAMRFLSLTGVLMPALDELKQGSPSPESKAGIRNIELTLSSDAALRGWFMSHRADLDRLAKGIAPPDERSLCQALGLTAVERSDKQVKLVVGGVLDNTVGFFYSATEPPPAISTAEFIWVEELAPRWCLYRTT